MISLWSGPPGFTCWISFAQAFQCWTCWWVLILFHLSNEPRFICLVFWFIDELEVLYVDRITCICYMYMNYSRARLKLPPPPPELFIVIYYWPFQGGAYNCQCLSAFCWSLANCSFYLSYGHLLGKSCPLVFSLVLFLVQSLLYVSLSHLVFGAGCGIRLYRFLAIAFFIYFMAVGLNLAHAKA